MRRDPYTGPSNPLPSLWQSQEAYQGDDPLRFTDMGVFGDAAVGGSVVNTTYCDIQESIQAPVVFGINEPHIDLWVQFEGNEADSFRVEVRRPGGSIYASYADALAEDARFGWFWVYWFWNGAVGPADYGTWTARTCVGGAIWAAHCHGKPASMSARPRSMGRGSRARAVRSASTDRRSGTRCGRGRSVRP